VEQKTINKSVVKALAFDFGGTLDSPFLHWMDVYLQVYDAELHLVNRESFRDSYVFAEREMERLNNVAPDTHLLDLQLMKTRLQVADLVRRGLIDEDAIAAALAAVAGKVENADAADADATSAERLARYVATSVTNASALYTGRAASTLAKLSERYTLLLVSNYYGNIRQVAADMGIARYFTAITDSTIEHLRKPDPALWRVAIERQGLDMQSVVVIGDSVKNDILPGLSLGCQVVHCANPLKGNDGETTPYVNAISELEDIL
jgi:putative hydrolase of the HAD superfamily